MVISGLVCCLFSTRLELTRLPVPWHREETARRHERRCQHRHLFYALRMLSLESSRVVPINCGSHCLNRETRCLKDYTRLKRYCLCAFTTVYKVDVLVRFWHIRRPYHVPTGLPLVHGWVIVFSVAHRYTAVPLPTAICAYYSLCCTAVSFDVPLRDVVDTCVSCNFTLVHYIKAAVSCARTVYSLWIP